MSTTPHRPRSFRRRLATAAIALAATAGLALPAGGTTDQTPGTTTRTTTSTTTPRGFEHRSAQVGDVRLHYVTGGRGTPLVLLHGWPQTWYGWRDVMPELARHHTVYAIDLPGLGDSRGAPRSYDKATLARYLHRLLADELGLDRVDVVAHDLGAGVGYQYAAQFGDHVGRYAHLDYPLPGPALTAEQYRTFHWHLAFHSQERIPEQVVDREDVRGYLAAFYPQVAYGGTAFGGEGARSPFTRRDVDEFARTYRRPAVLHGGFELYRTLDEDERDNVASGPARVPTLLMSAEGGMAGMRATTDPLLPDVRRAVEVPRAGHWLMEENPAFVTRELLTFLDGAR